MEASLRATVVRDLIRRDQERNDRIAAMQRLVDEGLQSAIGARSKEALFAKAQARLETTHSD